MSELTLAKLREAKAMLDQLAPPPPPPEFARVDLYGHSLGDGKVYTIPWCRPGHPRERSVVLVPRSMLHVVYDCMLLAGVDVRLEPLYALPPGDARILAAAGVEP